MKKVICLCLMALSTTIYSQPNLVPQPLPCLNITGQNMNIYSGDYYNDNCIHIGLLPQGTLLQTNGNSQLNLQSGKEIRIENAHLKVQGNSNMHLFIEKENIETVWYAPNNTPGTVGKYKRLELGFKLSSSVNDEVNNFINNTSGGLNPFDPDQVDFRIKLTSPSGQQVTRYAFYYQPFTANLSGSSADPQNIVNEWVADTTSFPWRFRFAPDELGVWSVRIELYINNTLAFEQLNSSFECVPSNHKGNLMVSHNGDDSDRWLYYKETGESFFSVGMNLSHGGFCEYLPSQNLRHMNGIQKLIDVGGNLTRFEISPQGPLPDWDQYNNYQTKQDEMYGFDKVIDLCEGNDLYFILFRHHIEMTSDDAWAGSGWSNNPYNLQLSATLEGYFLDSGIEDWQNKCTRYIYSRWGYSKNLLYYGYSEADNWYIPFKNAGNYTEWYSAQTFKNWVARQQNFIRSELNSDALFAHSNARNDTDILYNPDYSVLSLSDVISKHSYGEVKNFNFKDRSDAVSELWGQFGKPILFEEMGTNYPAMYCCTGIEFHNAIWASAMMGTIGSGLDWHWDRGVMDNNYHTDLTRLSQFFEDIPFKELQFIPQKWDDVSGNLDNAIEKRKLENFALVSKNKELVLGWIHNATFYWRNLAAHYECVNNLASGNYVHNTPCHTAIDQYGVPWDYNPWSHCDPLNFHNMYDPTIESLDQFGNGQFNDDYTDEGGYPILVFQTPFKIKDLKPSFGLKKHHYKIEFFNTHFSYPPSQSTQTLHTNAFGTLQPYISNLYLSSPDVAYKINYLGFYKNRTESQSKNNQEFDQFQYIIKVNQVQIIPNPNSGVFNIESLEEIEKVTVYNLNGEAIYQEAFNPNRKVELKLEIPRGTYLIEIQNTRMEIIIKKILVL